MLSKLTIRDGAVRVEAAVGRDSACLVGAGGEDYFIEIDPQTWGSGAKIVVS